MSNLKWIMSEGGPLICMEKRFMESWRGCDALSIGGDGAPNDYERAARVFDYLEVLSLRDGQALVFGEGPLDTSIWRSNGGQLFLVRVFACEEEVDVESAIQALKMHDFDNPGEALDFSFATSDLVLFDSAEAGNEPAKDCLAFSITPGRYKILTQPYHPDSLTSLVLHRFDPINGTGV